MTTGYRSVLLLLAAALALQMSLSVLPDTMGDLLEYRLWTGILATDGITPAYWPGASAGRKTGELSPIDYPPVIPYVLWVSDAPCERYRQRRSRTTIDYLIF